MEHICFILSSCAGIWLTDSFDMFKRFANVLANKSMVTCLTNILKIFQESDLKICPILVSGTYAMCVSLCW